MLIAGSMRKLPLLLATTLLAVGAFSAHASYAGVVRAIQIDRTPSALILKVHAQVQATLERALEHPDLPPFVVDGARHTRR